MSSVYVPAPAPAPYVAAQPQQQMVSVQLQPGCCHVAHYKTFRALGIVQVVCGSCSAVLGIVSIFLGTLGSFTGFPIWGGILIYLVAGLLGIIAASKKTRGLVLAFMVMCIIAAIAAGAAICLHSVSAAIGPILFNPGNSYYSYSASLAVDLVITVVALVEFVVAIVGASMSCGGITNKNSSVVHYQAAPMQVVGMMSSPPQAMYTPNAQPQYVPQPYQGIQGTQQVAGAVGASPQPAQQTVEEGEKLPIDPPQYH